MVKLRLAYTVGGSTFPVMPAPILAERAPTTNDTNYSQGQIWFDNTQSPSVLYIYDGGGNWESGGNSYATTTEPGIVQLSSSIVGDAASLTLVPPVKLIKDYVDGIAIAGAPAWSETVSGIGELSTIAEAQAGTNDTTAMTPLKVAAALAAGLPVTGGAGSFTTLAASGLSSLSGSATILTAGTALNLGSDNDSAAVNLAVGTTARTVGIANSAAAHLVTIGSTTGAAALTLQSGTGSVNIASTGTGDIIINSDDTLLLDADGVLELNSSAGAISIGNDADAQAINIGTGGAARTITLGNSTGATSLVLDAGTGAINVGTNAIAHTVTIGNGTGATSVVLDAGTGPINVGTNAVAHTVTIGNVTGATAVNINAGTGGSTWTTTNATLALASGTGAINIGTDAAAHTITLGNSTGATAVSVNVGTGALNLGTNAIAHTVTIGNVTGATAVNINTGTGGSTYTTTNGNFALNTGTGTIGIGTDAAAKTITIGNITGATAVNVNSGSGATAWTTTNGSFGLVTGTGAINLGTDAVAKTITIGNVTGATAVNVNSGSAASAWTTANGSFGVVTGTGAINIGADAAAKTITIGNQTGATSVVIDAGTGALNIGTAIAKTITIGNVTGATAVNVNAGSGGSIWTTTNSTLALRSGTGALQLGADAAAKTITLGNTTGATAVNIDAGSGGVNCSTDFNLTSVATKITMNGGAVTDFIGTSVLVLGTVTIANTNIAAGDRIFLSRTAANGSVTLGELTYTISAGASFTVTSLILGTPASTQTADVSSFAYFIVRQT